MPWKITVRYYGIDHWFVFPKLILLYILTACLQINTSKTDEVGNKTSTFIYTEPSPSLGTQSIEAIQADTETPTLRLYNDVSIQSTLTNYEMRASIIARTLPQINNASSSLVIYSNKNTNTYSHAIQEDHSVVFYKQVNLVFEIFKFILRDQNANLLNKSDMFFF